MRSGQSGQSVLRDLHERTLLDVVHRSDPFDLAFARLDQERLDELPHMIQERLDSLAARLREAIATQTSGSRSVSSS